MEDRFAIVAEKNDKLDINYSLYGVFDGHGGDQAAQFCVDHLPQILNKNKHINDSFEIALTETFESVDEAFLKISRTYHFECGTCANVVLTDGKNFTIANTGDSRSILVKKNGSVGALSKDHKPNRADEKERIQKAGGSVISIFTIPRVQGLLAVSRAIGDLQLKQFVISEPELTSITKKSDDLCIILATDGLWDVITNVMAGSIAKRILIDEVLNKI